MKVDTIQDKFVAPATTLTLFYRLNEVSDNKNALTL